MSHDDPSAFPGRDRGLLDGTEQYLIRERLRGWDPYDALCSPFFALPVLRSNRLVRFGAQQVIKRLPFNVRPFLRIPKQLNPVSVALYAQGQAHRARAAPSTSYERREEAQRCIKLLEKAVSPGWSGAAWGYPFDWEARYASIPANTPTIVATGMVTNALAVADAVFDLANARELILSAARFVLHDLHRIPGPDNTFCWSYSPLDQNVVLNATLKGSRLLAQAHTLGASTEVLEPAARSARFVVGHQSRAGAWPYAIGDARRWADNFHTGYILECLKSYRQMSGDESVDVSLQRGWRYYRDRFFERDMTPKYYDSGALPTDATACAQAIITLCVFDDLDGARNAAARTVATLGRRDGSFSYQRRRWYTVKTPFLRWSTAWMYCAMSRLEEDLRA